MLEYFAQIIITRSMLLSVMSLVVTYLMLVLKFYKKP